MSHVKIRKLVLAALFAALCTVMTLVIQIPSPMQGYVNLGDCAVLLSGEEDIVADGRRAAAITGGSPLTPLVTGTGCMLSVLCGAFAAVEPNAFDAALMASVFWKACSERAEHVSGGAGPGSLRAALMDSARALVPGSPCFDGRVQAL